jgi:nucleotide-binding universal stress UspA family protein
MKTNQITNQRSFNNRGDSNVRIAPHIFNALGAQRGAQLNGIRGTHERVKNIVVPLDGSAFAEHAIPIALGIAEQSGATLHLVHVFIPVDVMDPFDALHFPDNSLESLKQKKEEYLSFIVHQLAAVTPAFVTSTVVKGRAVSQSIENVHGIGADLIVMATHGRGVLGRVWWGSTAHSVLQHASVPLILVRGSSGPVSFAPRPINHVLLPLDGTKASEHVLHPIMERNLFPLARHTLLKVVGLEPSYEIRDSRLRMDLVPSRQKWEAAKRYLSTVARSCSNQSRFVHTKVVASEDPLAGVVIYCAETDGVDLISLVHHPGGVLDSLFHQGISEQLFRTAICPLMFVPSQSQT